MPMASPATLRAVELVGRPPPRHRQVVRGRPQVLADGDDVDADRAQVGEGAHHLVVGLAQADDQARLGGEPAALARASTARLRA